MSLAGNTGAYPGAAIPARILSRLACDAPLRAILLDPHGAVLHHGRSRRFATPAQKRALTVRDGGCIIPGCDIPPEWCDTHHLTPWRDGGLTDIDAQVFCYWYPNHTGWSWMLWASGPGRRCGGRRPGPRPGGGFLSVRGGGWQVAA